jgi:hypothetical protein
MKILITHILHYGFGGKCYLLGLMFIYKKIKKIWRVFFWAEVFWLIACSTLLKRYQLKEIETLVMIVKSCYSKEPSPTYNRACLNQAPCMDEGSIPQVIAKGEVAQGWKAD